jgi:hypothetical protein
MMHFCNKLLQVIVQRLETKIIEKCFGSKYKPKDLTGMVKYWLWLHMPEGGEP